MGFSVDLFKLGEVDYLSFKKSCVLFVPFVFLKSKLPLGDELNP